MGIQLSDRCDTKSSLENVAPEHVTYCLPSALSLDRDSFVFRATKQLNQALRLNNVYPEQYSSHQHCEKGCTAQYEDVQSNVNYDPIGVVVGSQQLTVQIGK
jgi:hypothetical protein